MSGTNGANGSNGTNGSNGDALPMGRPSGLTPEIQERIINAVLSGCYIETAVVAAGIHKSMFYRWLKQGNKEESGPFRDFSDAVNEALAQSELRDLAILDRAAQGYTTTKVRVVEGGIHDGEVVTETVEKFDWQAAAWKLERRAPHRWGRRMIEVHEADHESMIEMGLQLTELVKEIVGDEQAQELLKRLQDIAHGEGDMRSIHDAPATIILQADPADISTDPYLHTLPASQQDLASEVNSPGLRAPPGQDPLGGSTDGDEMPDAP